MLDLVDSTNAFAVCFVRVCVRPFPPVHAQEDITSQVSLSSLKLVQSLVHGCRHSSHMLIPEYRSFTFIMWNQSVIPSLSLRVERAATVLSLKIWQTKGHTLSLQRLGVHSCVRDLGKTDVVFPVFVVNCFYVPPSCNIRFPIFCERKFLIIYGGPVISDVLKE